MPHPIQDLHIDPNGTIRFRENKIVSFLYETSRNKLNELVMMPFSQEDFEQFYQLIGYSLSGFAELHLVSDETYLKAETMAGELRGEK